MTELNPHILLVMQWLQNPVLVSKEKLAANNRAAKAVYVAADAAYDVAHFAHFARYAAAADYAAESAYTAARAANAAESAYTAANAAYTCARYAISPDFITNDTQWRNKITEALNEYFELTKENRETHEERAKHLNVLGANNEQYPRSSTKAI